ncbi:MAG: glyoxylate reductase [Paenibacillaceae bacterium]|jgi:phosphoglycerate dehydrogenase-like enzyme|nr:glyoxylate reductase [Paenibacillaceae bacterium]
MNRQTILYFDPMTEDMKELLRSQLPSGYDLYFWDEQNDVSKPKVLAQAKYLMATVFPITGEMIRAAGQTRHIQKCGVGLDNIDMNTASGHGISVSNIPGCNAVCVAELTVMFILSLYRKLPYANNRTKQGEWLTWALRPDSFEMRGKTHGLVGMGHVGWETALRSKAMGTSIVYYDKNRLPLEKEVELNAEFLGLEQLLQKSDIISVHVPLLPATKGLINSASFKLMKPNAVLINVARGGVVDEAALYEALVNGEIKGAAVDVWEQEPVNPAHPLLTLEQVIATPHIGGGTRDTLIHVYHEAFNNIQRVEHGLEPLYAGNMELLRSYAAVAATKQTLKQVEVSF